MGNCLALQQDKKIRVMKTDGKILEYQAPLRARQVLSEFPGHEISDSNLPLIARCLHPSTKMFAGHLYYLLPLTLIDEKMPPSVSNLKTVAREKTTTVVRIKLVITKQELKDMLEKGAISVADDMVFQLENKQDRDSFDADDDDDADGIIDQRCKGWKPVLQSIPE